MNFSTNQVRQFYVAKALKTTSTALTNIGDIQLLTATDGKKYFVHVGEGGKTRSDLIDPKKIIKIEHTISTELALFNKSKTASVAAFSVDKPYTITVVLTNLYGAGDEFIQPIVATASAASAEALYTALAETLTKAVKKNYPYITFTNDGGVKVSTDLAKYNEGWDPATAPLKDLTFEVYGEGFTVTEYEKASSAVPGTAGKKLAELEYFCMGERGDQYRGAGYPYNIKTKAMLNGTETYDVVDIHYYFDDSNEGVQKSEKDLTIVGEASVISNIIKALKGTVSSTEGLEEFDQDFLEDA